MDNIASAGQLITELKLAGAREFDLTGQKMAHQVYTALADDQLDYGTTVTYLLQQINGYHFAGIANKTGYYFTPDNGSSICPFTVTERPLDGQLSVGVVAPRGPRAVQGIKQLARIIAETGIDCAFYVKKPSPDLSEEMYEDARQNIVPWNQYAPFEDDTYDGISANLEELAGEINLENSVIVSRKKTNLFPKLRYDLRRLENRVEQDDYSLKDFSLLPYMSQDFGEAEIIIKNFFQEKEARSHLSRPTDYFNLFNYTDDWRRDQDNSVVRSFTLCGNRKIGLSVAERIGVSDRFGLYCGLTNEMPDHNWSFSGLQLILVAQKLFALGGVIADFGGAETEGLQKNHIKFLSKDREKEKAEKLKPVANAPWLQFDL